ASNVKKTLPERLWNKRFLLQIPQQQSIQGPSVTEVQPHPLRGISRLPIRNTQRPLRSRCLKLVRQRVVVSPVCVMQKTANRAQKIDRARRQILFRRSDIQRLLVLGNLSQPNRRLIVAQSARRI